MRVNPSIYPIALYSVLYHDVCTSIYIYPIRLGSVLRHDACKSIYIPKLHCAHIFIYITQQKQYIYNMYWRFNVFLELMSLVAFYVHLFEEYVVIFSFELYNRILSVVHLVYQRLTPRQNHIHKHHLQALLNNYFP